MKITFIGVGSATDPHYPNVSIYAESKNAKILLDSGTTIAHEIIKRPNLILETDAIYISHRHGDHFFGLPTVLLEMKDLKRQKPMIIFGYKGFKEFVLQGLKLAYSTIFDDVEKSGKPGKLGYPIEFIEIDPAEKKEFLGLVFEIAPTIHFEINYALKITEKENEKTKSVVYSGDGMFTEEGKKLYKGCDLLIHESFTIDEPVNGHAIAKDLIKMSKENGVKALALIHFREHERQYEMQKLHRLIKKEKFNAFVPEPGTMLMV